MGEHIAPLTVIVVTMNSSAYVAACLRSIRTFVPHANVIVVDNASTDGTDRMDLGPATRVRLPRNVGYALAADRGAAASDPGGPILFLNPDAYLVDPIGPALDMLEAPDTGAISLSLIDVRGRPQPGVTRRFPTLARVVGEQLGLRALGTSPPHGVGPVDWVPGAALLIRRDAWHDVGPFDPAFPFYGEDVDWFLRARARGWGVRVAPGVRAVHAGEGSIRTIGIPSIVFAHEATLRLMRKHPGLGSPVAARAAMVVGSLARAALAGTAGIGRPRSRPRARAYATAAERLLGGRTLLRFPPEDAGVDAANVWLVEPLGRGGTAHYAHLLAEGLLAEGAAPALFTSTRSEFASEAPYPMSQVFRYPPGDRTERALSALPSQAFAYARGLAEIARRARRLRPQMVHLHGPLVPVLELPFAAALRRAGVPLALTLHTVFEYRSPPSRVALRRLRELASVTFVHGEATLARGKVGSAHGKGQLIPHGPYGGLGALAPGREDARRWAGVPVRSPLVLFFGQIRPYKGLAELLDAFAVVAEHCPEARLVIAGRPHGPFAPYLDRIHRLGLDGHVSLRLGFHPLRDLAGVVGASDVVVLPYRDADQSGAVHLALGLGVPVITTRVGSIPEVVQDGVNGFLVTPGDHATLAARITAVLSDPTLRATLAEGAVATERRIPSWREIARRTLRAYPDRVAP